MNENQENSVRIVGGKLLEQPRLMNGKEDGYMFKLGVQTGTRSVYLPVFVPKKIYKELTKNNDGEFWINNCKDKNYSLQFGDFFAVRGRILSTAKDKHFIYATDMEFLDNCNFTQENEVKIQGNVSDRIKTQNTHRKYYAQTMLDNRTAGFSSKNQIPIKAFKPAFYDLVGAEFGEEILAEGLLGVSTQTRKEGTVLQVWPNLIKRK